MTKVASATDAAESPKTSSSSALLICIATDSAFNLPKCRVHDRSVTAATRSKPGDVNSKLQLGGVLFAKQFSVLCEIDRFERAVSDDIGDQDATKMVTKLSKSGRNEWVRSWGDLELKKRSDDMWPGNDTGRVGRL